MSWFTRLLNGKRSTPKARLVQIFLTNTLSGGKELFVSQKPKLVLMYSCGPTVYDRAHIGNLRAYVFSDTLVRVLYGADYRVQRVINITDFGHLTSNADEGEDKMTKGLHREGLPISMENMRALAEKYAAIFLEDLEELNIDINDIRFPRASDYVAEQIALIQTLEQKGYAYPTRDGVYFDTARFANYGKLGGVRVDDDNKKTRIAKNVEKHNLSDFALWKHDSLLGWKSPWGLGFPGWHIECSAMARSLLGQEIDIHTGGEDHIVVHHNNEIAQSEAASGRTFAHYWLHSAFLTMGGEKASKSIGNVIYLSDITTKGFDPLALRYFFLQAHYRTPLSFSFEALASAASALDRLWRMSREILNSAKEGEPSEANDLFLATIRDDLATPQAIGILWDSLKNEEYTPEEKRLLLETADAHLGLSLLSPPMPKALAEKEWPKEIRELLAARASARAAGDFTEADRLRSEIEKSGYRVEDSQKGPVLTKRT